MKQQLQRLFLFLVMLGTSATAGFSQCANDNTLVPGSLTPPGPLLSTTATINANQYMLAFVQAGASYTINTCSTSSFDTQLTVYNDLTSAFIVYNDDFCGVQSSVTFTPNFCGNVRVLVDRYFCQTSANDVATVVMTMNSAGSGLPALTTAPDPADCIGDAVAIGIAGNGSSGTPPYTYAWLPAVNLSATNQPQVTATVTATTSYTLTLTDANGCMAMDTVLLTANPSPVVNLGPDTTVCVGPYIADAQNPGGSYLWSTGAGTQTLPITNSGSYSVIVVNSFGCQGGDNVNVVINPAPVFELGNDTSTCSNQLILSAASGFSSYSWSSGSTTNMDTLLANDTVYVTVTDANGCQATDSLIATINPATIVNLGPDIIQCGGTATLDAQNPGSLYFWSNSTSNMTTTVSSSGTYYVDVISPAGCQGADTILVTIYNQPIVDLGADTSVCQNTITLDAGTPNLNYLWSNSQITQQVIVGAGTHWVTVTDPNGGCSDSDTIQVTTNILPVVTAGSDITICPNQIATLTANGAATYLWSNGGTTQTIQVSPSISTTYYVTGTDVNGCQATDVVNVVVLPSSSASFTHVMLGVTAVFTNTSTNAVTYSWNFGDSSPLDNSANPTHTYTVNGTYTVTLTVTGPCGTETYTQVIVISEVGIQDQDLANSLSLFPNPNGGQFTLSFAFESASDVIIDVIDIRGARVYQESLNGITGYNKEISLTNAEAGLYFVRIQTTNGVVTKKIVVQ